MSATGDDVPAEPAGASDDPTPAELAEQRRRRRELTILLTPLSLAVVAGLVANVLTPTLLQEDGGHPLALIALDPSNRNLVLAASSVDIVPFYVFATLRLVAVDPFTYLLGLRYGDAGVRWIERRLSGLKPTVDFLERAFKKAAPLAVALAPGAIVCTLAGAARMRVGLFAVANVGGTLARLAILRATGEVFAGPVGVLREFFDRYLLPTTVASVALVALWLWWERRRGAADAETPFELAEELEEELEHEPEDDHADHADHAGRPTDANDAHDARHREPPGA